MSSSSSIPLLIQWHDIEHRTCVSSIMSISSLHAKLISLFGPSFPLSPLLYYVDEDNEQVLMDTDLELNDALSQANKRKDKQITIIIKEQQQIGEEWEKVNVCGGSPDFVPSPSPSVESIPPLHINNTNTQHIQQQQQQDQQQHQEDQPQQHEEDQPHDQHDDDKSHCCSSSDSSSSALTVFMPVASPVMPSAPAGVAPIAGWFSSFFSPKSAAPATHAAEIPPAQISAPPPAEAAPVPAAETVPAPDPSPLVVPPPSSSSNAFVSAMDDWAEKQQIQREQQVDVFAPPFDGVEVDVECSVRDIVCVYHECVNEDGEERAWSVRLKNIQGFFHMQMVRHTNMKENTYNMTILVT